MTTPRGMVCLTLAGLALSAGPSAAQTVRLRGTVVVKADEVVQDGTVTTQGQKIAGVVPAAASDPTRPIDGVIFPGLIDLHNHLTWNVLPNWQPPQKYTNRYAWQDAPEYALNLSGPYAALMA